MPVICNECKEYFKNEAGLNIHKARMHKASGRHSSNPVSTGTHGVCNTAASKTMSTSIPHQRDKGETQRNGTRNKSGYRADTAGNARSTKPEYLTPPYKGEERKTHSNETRSKNDFRSDGREGHLITIKTEQKIYLPKASQESTESSKIVREDKRGMQACRRKEFDKPQTASAGKSPHQSKLTKHAEMDRRSSSVESHSSILNNPGQHIDNLKKRFTLRKKDIEVESDKIRDFLESDRGFIEKINRKDGGPRWHILTSGSYYDKTKNFHPDEFDFMICPENCIGEIVLDDQTPPGFCKVRLINTDDFHITTKGFLDPSKFKRMAFDIFDEAKGRYAKRQMRDGDSPAYTVMYKPGAGARELDIDLVPAIEIPYWPKFCKQVAPAWEEDDKFRKKCMQKCHVVAKTCTEKAYKDSNLLWRLSFSWAEKQLILHANCGNERSIRKEIFRILKGLLEETKVENTGKIKKLCSFHLKMFMLHQFDAWPHARDDKSYLRDRFIFITEQLIRILQHDPRRGYPRIENYFLKGDNVIRHVPREETELFRSKLIEELQNVQ